MANSIYFDITKILGYNALYNFIIGERGVGKTVATMKFCIKQFIENGNQFIYVRRYKKEMDQALKTLFDDIIHLEFFEGHTIKVDKKGCLKIDDEIAGWAIPLSTANVHKSTPFPNVKYIIFEEFMLDKGAYRYLQNEVTQFLELYETVARFRDVKVFFLGNAISVTNPYFLYFGIDIPYNSEFKTFANGTILFHYIKNEAYREAKRNSRFGQLIAGTEYGEYAINNQFLRDNVTFIRKKTGDCKHWINIKLNGRIIGIWMNKHGELYVSNDHDPTASILYTFKESDHDTGTIFLPRSHFISKSIIDFYRTSQLFFESQKLKNEFMQVMSKLLIY